MENGIGEFIKAIARASTVAVDAIHREKANQRTLIVDMVKAIPFPQGSTEAGVRDKIAQMIESGEVSGSKN